MNGKIILENNVINNERKKIELHLIDDTNELKILAVNEGQSPPNTVHFLLHDKEHNNPVITNLKKGESTNIKIIKKK